MKNCRFENLEKYKKKWTQKYGGKSEKIIKKKIKKIEIEKLKLKLKSGNNYKNYRFSENKTFFFLLQKF